jgi:HEPN domain-containing protein
VFSPSPEQIEYAELLLRRANGDLQACRVLSEDADIDDNIVGFHAQQAVEKAMKVVLVLADADLPLTHDLKFLLRQLRETGTEPPDDISQTSWLTPWAAELRYDEPIALDRAAALRVAESATDWAASLLADAKRPPLDPTSGSESREEAPSAGGARTSRAAAG